MESNFNTRELELSTQLRCGWVKHTRFFTKQFMFKIFYYNHESKSRAYFSNMIKKHYFNPPDLSHTIDSISVVGYVT